MKKSLFILLLLQLSCVSQNDSKNKSKTIDTTEKMIIVESSLSRSINQSTFESYFISLADSINNAFEVDELPKFLKNADFDIDNSFFWIQDDSSISLRDIIISRINNCHSLKLIISDPTGLYKKKPSQTNKIKFDNFSFYELALQRQSKLACNK